VHVRPAKIAAGDVGRVNQELFGQRAIQAKLGPHERVVGGITVLSGEGDYGIARRRVNDHEGDDDDASDGRNDLGEPSQQVAGAHRA
jgi:hypothetical protein